MHSDDTATHAAKKPSSVETTAAVSPLPSSSSILACPPVEDPLSVTINKTLQRCLPPPPIAKEGLVALSSFPIHSSYVIKERIGQGTWGSVHVAVERVSGLERAVKKIPKRFVNELLRFRQEITFLKGLDHPNIVRLYETFEDYANIYMVMEFCRGGELFDRITSCSYFSEASAARLLHQILLAIHYIHGKCIAHRDIKPENFLFLSRGNDSPMKLIDFGLAKRFNRRRQLRTKVGTLYYVAPQVLKGGYDEKCDVWSAGVILYLLLSGTPPFNGPTDACIMHEVLESQVHFTGKIWKHVSVLAKDLVQQMLHKDPEKRLSANQALSHAWFQLFSPSALTNMCLPRPMSMPALFRGVECCRAQDLLELQQNHRHPINTTALPVPCDSTSQTAVLHPFPHLFGQSTVEQQTQRLSVAGTGCCELSVFGMHSPLCLSRVRVDPHVLSPEVVVAPHFVQFADGLSSTAVKSHNVSCMSSHSEILRSKLPIVPLQPLMSSGEEEQHRGADNCSANGCGSVCAPEENLELWRNLARRLVPRWKRFARHNQLKKAALRVIAQQLYDGDENIQPLRSLFLALDSRNDGALSSDELYTGMGALQCSLRRDGVDVPETITEISSVDAVDRRLSASSPASSSSSSSSTCPSCSLSLSRPEGSSVPLGQERFSKTEEGTQSLRMSAGLSGSTSQPLPPSELSAVGDDMSLHDSLDSSQLDSVSGHKDDVPGDCSSEKISWCEKSGVLEPMLTVGEIQDLLNAVSLDGGDVLEYSDFIAASMEQKHYLREDILRAAFRVFDRDGDGRINPSELKATLGWLDAYNKDSELYGRQNEAMSKAAIDQEMREILKTWDHDGDGSISYDDFVTSIRAENGPDETPRQGRS